MTELSKELKEECDQLMSFYDQVRGPAHYIQIGFEAGVKAERESKHETLLGHGSESIMTQADHKELMDYVATIEEDGKKFNECGAV